MKKTKKVKKNLAVVLGTRPNFIKAAPFFKEARKRGDFDVTLIHTGQHYDEAMSDIFFRDMGLPSPDVKFTVADGQHTKRLGKMFNDLTTFFQSRHFDGVIVFGDVNSTLAGALSAAKSVHRLVHIEAGLRSHDRRMPEEINRCIVDHLSDLLFTSEPEAIENLRAEGIADERVHHVGNIMIECLELYADRIEKSKVLQTLSLKPKEYVLATLHRVENTDSPDRLEAILDVLGEVNTYRRVVMPLHPSTEVKIATHGFASKLSNLTILKPQGYFEFLKLMKESSGVLTDSGGVQEETSHLGIPCGTLRDNTERPITTAVGSNKLFPIGNLRESVEDIKHHLGRQDFRRKHVPLWDDKVSERIFDVLENTL